MSGHRKGRANRRKDVSIADRLGPSSSPSSARSSGQPKGDGSILPGGATPTRSRRALREERKRKKRQRSTTLIFVVIGALIVGLLAFWWFSRDEEPTAAPVDPGRTERTLTVTLAKQNEPATSGALMVADPDAATAGAVLVPSRVFVDGPVPEGIPFGDTVTLGTVAAPGTALADTLDVLVDGTWQLSPASLAALVDELGGVTVDVDVDVLSEPGDGRQEIVIAEGDSQELNGEQAALFAQYLADGEPEEARLVRFGEVLDQLARFLPANPEQVSALLTQTDAASIATGTTEQISDFLVAYGDVARSGDAGYQTLATIPLEVGGAKPASTVDPEGAERLRQTLLAGSLPPSGSGSDIKVLVFNGVGTPGIEQEAATLLRDEGYEFVNGGNEEPFDDEDSLILIPDSSTASLELGAAVAETLGLPLSSRRTTDQGATVADVIVILGADFDP